MDKPLLPLIKENDEPGLAPVLGEIRVSMEDEEALVGAQREDESSPTTRTLRLNI